MGMAATAEQGFSATARRDVAAFWGGLALALGSAGVVVTSVFYKLSPLAAAMPVLPADYAAARAGAIAGASTMRLAGLFGVSGDVLITAGAFLLAGLWLRNGRGAGALGWLLIGISTIVFTVVDALVGFVLTATAAEEASGFIAAKSLFDALFMQGTACFGLGAVLFALPEVFGNSRFTPRLLAVAALLVGALAAASGLGGLMGFNLHNPIGLSVISGSALFTVIGLGIALRRPG